jgi:transcriptional regulator with PAS, ATPase and Fis domain
VISATNRDLESKVREGAFREDLYYRLNVVVMSIPPLRERKADISPLVDYFLKRYARDNGKDIDGLSHEARDLVLKYDYPGNVRELENIIERAVVISRGRILTVEDLPFRSRPTLPEVKKQGNHMMKASIEALEHRLIGEAMQEAQGNQTRAAELLGISERMLRYKLKKYGLKH